MCNLLTGPICLHLPLTTKNIKTARVCLNTANHHKTPQITAIHRKSGASDFNDATTDRKSVKKTANRRKTPQIITNNRKSVNDRIIVSL